MNKNKNQCALSEAIALASIGAATGNNFFVRYQTMWIEKSQIYIVMELCQGSIKSLIKQHLIKFSESTARDMLKDICKALTYIHRDKVVHLDIKPDNILYAKSEKYKLGDFGQTKLNYRIKEDGTKEGDLRYMAPELLDQFIDEDSIPDLSKADIFSLGASIYELMIGEELAKNGSKWQAIRYETEHLFKSFNSNFSESLKNLIRKMMDKNPSNRPSAEDILNEYLPTEQELELKIQKSVIKN